MQLRKTLLALSFGLGLLVLGAQSADTQLAQLKAAVKEAGTMEGRDRAVGLALLGYDYLDANDNELQRLLYEAYYSYPDYGGFEGDYYELYFQSTDWSPNGRQIAVALSNGEVRLLDANNPSSYTTLRDANNDNALCVAWSPDGDHVACGLASGDVEIIDVSSGATEKSWSHVDYIRGVAWSPDGDHLAAGGDDNVLYIYNVNTGDQERAFSSHTDWIRNVSWSADGTLVSAASDDQTATIWSVTEGNLVMTHRPHNDYCRDAAFAPNGNRFATCSDDTNVYLFDSPTAEVPERNLKGHEGWVMALDWSDDGKKLATADNGGTIIVHNLRAENETYYNAPEAGDSWMDIDFSPSADQIAATGIYKLVIYNSGSPTPVAILTPDGVSETVTESDTDPLEELFEQVMPSAVSLHPAEKGNLLGIINDSYQLEVIDTEAGRVLYTIDQHTDWIRNISWSPDGRLMATASDDMIVGIWDARTGDMQHFLSGHTDWVRDVDFSPDGKVVASAGDDGVLRFWDVNSGDELNVSSSVGSFLMSVRWSPDQKLIAAQSSDGYLYIWNTNNNNQIFAGTEVMTTIGSLNWTGNQSLTVQSEESGNMVWTPVEGLISAEGSTAGLSASSNGVTAKASGPFIGLSGSKTGLLQGHQGEVNGLDWSNDGKYLISQSTNGELAIWDASSAQLLALLTMGTNMHDALIWSSQGDGFFLPGAPGKIMLPPNALRDQLDPADYDFLFTTDDVIRFQIEDIFLKNNNTAAKLKANGGSTLLSSIADFYEMRAAAQSGSAAAADEKRAAEFRAAAE